MELPILLISISPFHQLCLNRVGLYITFGGNIVTSWLCPIIFKIHKGHFIIHRTIYKQHYTLFQTCEYIEGLYAKPCLSVSGTVDILNPMSTSSRT